VAAVPAKRRTTLGAEAAVVDAAALAPKPGRAGMRALAVGLRRPIEVAGRRSIAALRMTRSDRVVDIATPLGTPRQPC
jgi:hypothetical protein